MPAASRPPATMRRPRLPTIMVASLFSWALEAVLLAVEDPVVAFHDDWVAAGPGFSWHLRRPLHGVAKAGVEGTEVLGRVHEVLTREVVQDVALLFDVIDEPPGVVVVDGDEAGDVDVRRVLRHVGPVGLHLGGVRDARVGEDGPD